MKTIAVLLLCVLPWSAMSQQLPSWSSYYETGFVWNPALTARWNATELSLTHRQDWMGFDDAPKYSNVSFQYPFIRGVYLETKAAIGGFIERDVVGPIQKISGALTYNYRFRPQFLGNRRDVLGIGIVANYGWYQVDLSRAKAYDESTLTIDLSEDSRKGVPNVGVGAFYISVSDREAYTKSHYYMGLSLNQLIPNKLAEFNSQGAATGLSAIQSSLHATMHLGYRSVPVRAGYFIEPNLMFIYSLKKGIHAMASFKYEMIDTFWASAGVSTAKEAYGQLGYIFDRNSILQDIVLDGALRVGLKVSYNLGSFRVISGTGVEFYAAYVFEMR